MLSRFKMQNYFIIFIPIAEKALVKAPLGHKALKLFIKIYMKLVKSLMYFIIKIRPDLIYSVGQLN